MYLFSIPMHSKIVAHLAESNGTSYLFDMGNIIGEQLGAMYRPVSSGREEMSWVLHAGQNNIIINFDF